MKRILKTLLSLAVILAVLAVLAYVGPLTILHGLRLRCQSFELPDSSVEQAIFVSRLNAQGYIPDVPTDEYVIEIESSNSMAELAGLLQESQGVMTHVCTHMATLELTFESGTNMTLQLLPGHNDKYYEFRADKSFRIDRERFFVWTDSLGIPRSRIMPKSLDGAAPEKSKPLVLGDTQGDGLSRYGQNRSRVELTEEVAVAYGLVWLSVALFLHFHYFWWALQKLWVFADLGKVISLFGFIGSLGYVVWKVMVR